MKLNFFTLVAILFILHLLPVSAQSVSYVYDAAGNRISRTITLSMNKTKSQPVAESTDEPEPFIDYLNKQEIKIYPNPTRGQLQVEIMGSSEENRTSISVFNLDGKLIQTIAVSSSLTTIDLTAQPDGIYTMEIRSGEKTTSWKIIKE